MALILITSPMAHHLACQTLYQRERHKFHITEKFKKILKILLVYAIDSYHFGLYVIKS